MYTRKYTPENLVGMFIDDCLVQDVKGRLPVRTLFEIFEGYCDAIELANPLTINAFSALMAKRVQKVKPKNRTHFVCSLKDGVVSLEEDANNGPEV